MPYKDRETRRAHRRRETPEQRTKRLDYQARYRAEHREQARKTTAEYRRTFPEKVKAAGARYRERPENKEKARQANERRRAAHPDEVKAYQAAYRQSPRGKARRAAARKRAQQEKARGEESAEGVAELRVEDAIEVYRELAANLRYWRGQKNVPAARLRGLEQALAAAHRAVLAAQAELLRVQGRGAH